MRATPCCVQTSRKKQSSFARNKSRSGLRCVSAFRPFVSCCCAGRHIPCARKRRLRSITEPPEDRNKPDNCLLEIPGEAQLDGVVAGVIVALNLVIFVAEHEVRAIGDAELEAGLGSPGKLGGGNGSGTAAVFQSMNGGLHVAVSGADFAAQIEHGVVADGKVQRVTGHHRDIGGTEAGGIRPADAQVRTLGWWEPARMPPFREI